MDERTIQNPNIDYCGIAVLLRQLVADSLCTKREARKILSRVAAKIGADVILAS